jgi:PAS domain S-box-containing protein
MTLPNINLSPEAVLGNLNDGVYATDTTRRIVYWSESAERITGWLAEDVVGTRCSDNILCHVDKDNHPLCGEEYCPLHRAMVTDQASTVPLVVFAQGKHGNRVPMRVSVAPIRDASGAVIGGVESFQDLSGQIGDIRRAQEIQNLNCQSELPDDPRVRFATHYVPHDVIGGDFYAIAPLDADRYGFLLADVTGHGLSAALYTMYLASIWKDQRNMLSDPVAFAAATNARFCRLTDGDMALAAGICGMLDLNEGTVRVANAGNPFPLHFHNGQVETVVCPGLPLGALDGAVYEETIVDVQHGDCLLFFTDGAAEVFNERNEALGSEGLAEILKNLGYPKPDVGFDAVEEQILRYSHRIRFDDDLTFLEVQLPSR